MDDFTKPEVAAAPSGPPRVKLGAREFELVMPESYAARVDVVNAARANFRRAQACALGLCVPRLAKMLKVDYVGCDCSPVRYGGEVIDRLIAAQVPDAEVFRAGLIAWRFVCDSLVTEGEVAEAEGFFEDVGAPSTSTS